MKNCTNCGAQVPDDKKFCGACGYKFTEEDEQSQSQSQSKSQSQNYTYGQQGQSQQGGAQNDKWQDYANKAGAAFSSGADHTSEFDPKDIAANKTYAILACFGILFFIPLVAIPQSRYGKFCANQGLLLLITYFAFGIVTSIISTIFNFLWFLSFVGVLVNMVLWIIPFVLFIILIVNAANGKAKELPIIGRYTIIK
jgi:Predicted membrane protein